MKPGITYSLLNYQDDAVSFYTDLSMFTDTVLHDLDAETEGFVRDVCNFINENRIETPRSRNEYVVEFLMIGLYWNNYSGNALKTGNLSKKLLKILYEQSKKFPAYKAEIEKLRGYLAYLFLEKHSQYFR